MDAGGVGGAGVDVGGLLGVGGAWPKTPATAMQSKADRNKNLLSLLSIIFGTIILRTLSA